MNITNCASAVTGASFNIPFPLNYVIIFILILQSALFSGLTLGLLGLDKVGLEIVIAGEDAELAE